MACGDSFEPLQPGRLDPRMMIEDLPFHTPAHPPVGVLAQKPNGNTIRKSDCQEYVRPLRAEPKECNYSETPGNARVGEALLWAA